MKLLPTVIKSIRENKGDVGVLFNIGSSFYMIEERVLEESCSNNYAIVKQDYFDCLEEALEEFDELISAFKRDYLGLIARAEIDDPLVDENDYSLYVCEPNKGTVQIVSKAD